MKKLDLPDILIMVAAIGVIIAVIVSCNEGIKSIDFYKQCDAACSPSTAMTPIMNGHKTCLCDEGQGTWRRVTIPPM